MELRNATSGDHPVSFVDKLLAWETYGDIDFKMFVRFVSFLDSAFLKKQSEGVEKKRLESSKRRAQEAATKRAKVLNKKKNR